MYSKSLNNRTIMMRSSIDLDASDCLNDGSQINERPLAEKLSLTHDEIQNFDPIPAQLLRKVIYL